MCHKESLAAAFVRQFKADNCTLDRPEVFWQLSSGHCGGHGQTLTSLGHLQKV